MKAQSSRIFLALAATYICLGDALPTQFLYVANAGANSLSGYTVDPSTGLLTPIPGSPFAVAGSPWSVAVHPSGRFVYSTGFFDSTGINGYAINFPTGALSPLSGSPFPASGGNIIIALQPSGKFAWVTNGSGYNVSVDTIDNQSGALNFSQTSAVVPLTRRNLVVHPSGNFVYMTQDCVLNGNICDLNAPNTVQGYAADSNTGALTPLPGSPFAAGLGAGPLAVDPTGSFLYVGDAGSGGISAYKVDPASGALTSIAGSPFAPGNASPLAIAIAPQGGFVYVPGGDGMIWGYQIDSASGALTQISGSPWGSGQISLALSVDPTSKFLYVANYYLSSVSAFRIDAQTGALTAIPGSTVPAGNTPQAMAVTAIPKVTPIIVWPAPAAITYGTALSAAQLNATANVAGTFVYNPPAGTVLPPGNGQTLSVTFAPADTIDYSTATARVTINVLQPTAGAISLWAGTILGLGQAAQLPVTLSAPAPAGGVNIMLASSDPSTVTVTPTVFIPGGRTSANTQPQVAGLKLGAATISASAPNYTPASQQVQVTAMLSFARTVSIFAPATQTVTLNLSGPAPVGGLTVNLSSDDTGVATVPPSATFPAGATSVSVPVTGVAGGVTAIHANSPLPTLTGATISVTVVSTGMILWPQNATVLAGSSLTLPIALSAPAPGGGLTITLTSNNRARATVTPASVFIAGGATTPTTQPQVSGVSPGLAIIGASAPGFGSAGVYLTIQ